MSPDWDLRKEPSILMNRITFLDEQELPLSGPCPRCGHPASFRQHDPDTESYLVNCDTCGRYEIDVDELEERLQK